MPSMIESIVMRKCQISYKQAKLITAQARQQLHLSEESTLLWSKEYEQKCLEIHQTSSMCHPDYNHMTTTTNSKSSSTSSNPSRRAVQRHYSDSTDGNHSRDLQFDSNHRSRSTQHVTEPRKARSLSKPRRRKQSPAATATETTKTNTTKTSTSTTRVSKPPPNERRVKPTTSSSLSSKSSQESKSQSRSRRSVPRKSSSSSTLSSVVVDHTAKVVAATTTTSHHHRSTGSPHYYNHKSPTTTTTTTASKTTTGTYSSPTHLPISMSPFSLNESIHSMTSPRRPQRKLSFNHHHHHDNNNDNEDVMHSPTRTSSVISSQTFQSTDAVVEMIEPDLVDFHTTKSQPTTSKHHRSTRCDVEKKEREQSRPTSRSNDNYKNNAIDDNDTSHAQSPISTSILRRSKRWNDDTTGNSTSNEKNESTSPVVTSKPRTKDKIGSGRDNNKKSLVSVLDVERLNRSLSYLQGEESKKNKMYSLPTPLTPTEGSIRPKLQSRPVPTGQSGTGDHKSHAVKPIRNSTDRWSSSTVETLSTPKNTHPALPPQNHISSPISRPKIKKLTKQEEHFFDSFRSSSALPSDTTGESQKSQNNMKTVKSRRSSRNIDDSKKELEKISSRALDVTTTSESTSKKSKKSTQRRRLSAEELEHACQADPSFRKAMEAANHHHLHHVGRPSKISDTETDNDGGVVEPSFSSNGPPSKPSSSLGTFIRPRVEQGNKDDNQTVSTGSTASTKSKTRMVPVVKTKPKQEDLPTSSKTVNTKEHIPPVSPNKRISVVTEPKLTSPMGKKTFISDPPYQSPISFDKRMAAYKNTCESPVTAYRTDKAMDVAPVSPSKFQMIPMVHKSPAQRKSKPSDIERVDLPSHNCTSNKSTTMKNDMTNPSTNKISKHSVTSRTSHTTDTTRSTSSKESDVDDDWYTTSTGTTVTTTMTNNIDLPNFHDSFQSSADEDDTNQQITKDQIFPEFAPSRFAKPKVIHRQNDDTEVDRNDENQNTNNNNTPNTNRNNSNIPVSPPKIISDRAAKYRSLLNETSNNNHKNNPLLDDVDHPWRRNNHNGDSSTGAPKLPQRRRSTIVRD